ncbi:V-type proton ATPase 116 kDa subunit a-like isoform X2 [Varroa jacobsoni]|uniref:V-type proton ATPase 116 kDa subunit a-like isoform X2 n=1 Tax=Varroa jacobsoni TaxID=62625 RepID=UPI000BF84909|nr:V-type proton ATPase 116 kDa subunit a-like isoform X2 [Varroa jacobsoni]
MGLWFRSEPMAMCQVILQADTTYQCIAELGKLGVAQFVDLNAKVNTFQRKFVNDVRRCDEMQRVLRFVEEEIKKEGIQVLPEDSIVDTPLPKDMIDMEVLYQKMEAELSQVTGNIAEMNQIYVQLVECKQVLCCVDEFFETRQETEEELEDADLMSTATARDRPSTVSRKSLASLYEFEQPPGITQRDQDSLGFTAGIISIERFQSFERMMWRVGRGNIFVRQMFIDGSITDMHGEATRKCVILIFFSGEQLRQRVRKICKAFRVNIYPCPVSNEERRETTIGVLQWLEDMRKVFNGSQDHRMRILAGAARSIRTWKMQLIKMKSVFHIMNQLNMDVTQKCLIAECWIPDRDVAKVQAALRRGTEAAGSSFPCIINRLETDQAPPTFYRTNSFTAGFQNIVDAYGVGNYQEVNPAPYAIVTFPFLFAVMFGDAGHGLLMTLFACALLVYEKPLSRVREEITSMVFEGRYLILLMGLFSIYTGLIYNDTFSKSMNVFGSTWHVEPRPFEEGNRDPIGLRPEYSNEFQNRSYPFGIDPIWMISSNKIQFTNSYKMKMAIILGIMHMTFGVILGLWNHTFFKDRTGFPPPRTVFERSLRRNLEVWAVFIPEIIFLVSLFGYLVFMIFFKWLLPFGAGGGEGPNCSRSILIMFINMIMRGGSVGVPEKNVKCYQKPMYEGQEEVQKVILLVAVAAVPWLLMAKPLYLFYLNWVHSQPLSPDFVTINYEEQLMVQDEMEPKSEPSPSTRHRKKSAVSLHILKRKESEEYSVLTEQQDLTNNLAELAFQFDLSEVVIHQIIHTIEYCLGAVSNTASYLRLWALSLAHAQLSEVLWSMILAGALFVQDNPEDVGKHAVSSIQLYGSWAGWAILTVSILLLMEGLSAFLHALRLHWVEFMNKFFKGEGYAFAPFDFAQIIRDTSTEA